MKKLLCLVLTFALCLCASAALAQTITPIPTTISLDCLAHKEFNALITNYNPEYNTITLTLCDVEAFSAESILALQPGDVIVSNGEEYVVDTTTFSLSDRYCVVNQGKYDYEEGSLSLMRSQDKASYISLSENDATTWIPAVTVTMELPEGLILLDGIDPETGDMLTIPAAYDATAFATMLQNYQDDEIGVSFASSNVYVLFDEMNNPVVVRRFYVPWQ